MVHITNGDSVAGELRRWAGEPRLISWRDILHEGPVRAGRTLEELSAERSEFLGTEFGEEGEDLFVDRDRQMRRLVSRDAIWLWFEDDLYDQLQLLQILDFLNTEQITGQVLMIDIPRGLRLEQIAGYAAEKKMLGPAAFELASHAWAAFTAPDPLRWPALLGEDLSALPHLEPAVRRLIEHYPAGADGLNRIERTAMELLRNGPRTAGQLFVQYAATEERPFLGDSSFYWYLDRLAPAVQRRPDGFYELQVDQQPLRSPRWVGGVRFERA